MPITERRRVRRIFFKDTDNIEARAATVRRDQTDIQARVLNLSQDGIFITIALSDIPPEGFDAGTHLILHSITGTTPPMDIDDIRMEVRWFLQNQLLDHIGLGCKFLQMSADTREQLIRFAAVALGKIQ